MAGHADQDLQSWWLLASVQRRVTRDLNRTLQEELGYPPIWIDVLIALADTPRGRDLTMDLARKLGDRRSLTVLLNQMAGGGLIRRQPIDGRTLLVILTPRGRRELRRVLPRYRDAIQQTGLGNLTASEGRALQRLLRKVTGSDEGSPTQERR